MIEFRGEGNNRSMVVVSKTPRRSQFPFMNREQRRAVVYRNRLYRLRTRISNLRKDLLGAGIKPLPWPRHRSAKVLSGYMSQLIAYGTQKLRELEV